MKKIKKIMNKKILIKVLKRTSLILFTVIALFIGQASNVFATEDPLTVINNLSTFIFGVIKAIGMILLGWGIVQVGLALKKSRCQSKSKWIPNCRRRNNNNIFKTNTRFNYRRIINIGKRQVLE